MRSHGLSQGVADDALTVSTAMATAERRFQFRGHASQVFDSRLDIAQVLARQQVDLATWHRWLLGRTQQTADLVQGEAQTRPQVTKRSRSTSILL